MRISKYFIAPALMLALAGCGKNYGDADCVKEVQKKQGDKPSIVLAYKDDNDNRTVDMVERFTCRTRSGTFGMDEDCWVDEIHLLNNNYSNFARSRSDGTTYEEIGKRTEEGKAYQAAFEACRAEQK